MKERGKWKKRGRKGRGETSRNKFLVTASTAVEDWTADRRSIATCRAFTCVRHLCCHCRPHQQHGLPVTAGHHRSTTSYTPTRWQPCRPSGSRWLRVQGGAAAAAGGDAVRRVGARRRAGVPRRPWRR